MDEDYEFIDLSYFYKKMLEILENIKIPDMEEELAEYISSQTAQRPQPRHNLIYQNHGSDNRHRIDLAAIQQHSTLYQIKITTHGQE